MKLMTVQIRSHENMMGRRKNFNESEIRYSKYSVLQPATSFPAVANNGSKTFEGTFCKPKELPLYSYDADMMTERQHIL